MTASEHHPHDLESHRVGILPFNRNGRPECARRNLRKFLERYFTRPELPLRYSVMFFRHPRRLADGRWNCVWQQRLLYSGIFGIPGMPTEDTYAPVQTQFNILHLADWLRFRNLRPSLTVSARPAWPDMPDSPLTTHIDKLWDLIGLDQARKNDILTDDPDEAQPNVMAVIEHTTGMIIPVTNWTLLCCENHDDSSMTISVMPHRNQYEYTSLNDHERYDDDHFEQLGFDEARALRDIAVWEKALRREIDRIHSPEYHDLSENLNHLIEQEQQYVLDDDNADDAE